MTTLKTPLTEEDIKEIWNSDGVRFAIDKFTCSFCGLTLHDSSYSIVDGRLSCRDCDGINTILKILPKKKKMTKKGAVKQLINDFINNLIEKDWQNLSELDLAMIKALNIKEPKHGERQW